ncbi:MAG: hypothetical protein R2715_13905 [Ilumatobacteraceae bacterium]
MARSRRHPSIPNSLAPGVASRRARGHLGVVEWIVRILPAVFVVAGLLGTVAIIAGHDPEFGERIQVLGAIGFLAALVIAHTAFRAPVTLLAASATTVASFGVSRLVGNVDHTLIGPGRGDGLAELLGTAAMLLLTTAFVAFVYIRRGNGLRSIVADTLLVAVVGWLLAGSSSPCRRWNGRRHPTGW